MIFRILGCGSSTGTPQLGCNCEVCTSAHPRNKRTRASALIQTDAGQNILIDAGPDIKEQLLRHNIQRIDALYVTHIHADHTDGLNELRPLSFKDDKKIKLYIREQDLKELEQRFSYMFFPDPAYTGAPPAKFEINLIEANKTIDIFGLSFLPLELEHGNSTVAGFKLNDIAYLPDCNGLPPATHTALENIRHLIIDGIWPKKKVNHHFNIEQAIQAGQSLHAENIYITHLSHHVDYAKVAEELRGVAELCYDGMEIRTEYLL